MSVLAGLLSQIGMKDAVPKEREPGKRRPLPEYTGARGARFAIFPDSPQARKPPDWVVAAELVETSRLWARTIARIEPEWAEKLGEHLVKRSYSEPRWDSRRGAAMATEKVLLYGLPVVAARSVTLGRIDPETARDLFIQHALVEGDWRTHHKFWHRNQELLTEAEELERRARRRGIVADDSVLFAFYDQRIPADVTSARHFDSWWKKTRADQPDLLTLTAADLAGPAADEIAPADFPAQWGELPLSYEFAPGAADDGVTMDVPLASLNQVTGREFGWQVPGLREELVTELIRSLPKQLRRAFVPAPDTARAVLARLGPPHGDLLEVLGAELSRVGGVTISRDDFDLSRLPGHLSITFRVTDGDQVLAEGKDLAELKQQLGSRLRAMLDRAADGITRSGLTSWDFGALPRTFTNGQVRGYPALADAGDAVDIRLFDTQAQAAQAMARGTRRLILLQVSSGVRSVAGRLPVSSKLALSRQPYPSMDALLDDCAACAADQVIAEAGGPAWDADGFTHLLEAARARLGAATVTVVGAVVAGPGRGARGRGPAGQHACPRAGPRLRRPAAPAGRADLPGVRVRDRRGPAARPEPVPEGDDRAAGQDVRGAATGRRGDGGHPAGERGLPADAAGTVRRRPPRPGSPGCALDDRGAAGQPLRADPRHLRPGVGETGPARPGRPVGQKSPT